MKNQQPSSNNSPASKKSDTILMTNNICESKSPSDQQEAEQQVAATGNTSYFSISSTAQSEADTSAIDNNNMITDGAKTYSINSTSNSTSSNSASSGAESKADTEDDERDDVTDPGNGLKGDSNDGQRQPEDAPCECVQCEVCMAENWWRMAAYHNTLLQQQDGANDSSDAAIEISDNGTSGLDLIGSAATLMLNQQQTQQNSSGEHENAEKTGASTDDMLRTDFSMPKLREFFEYQKEMGIPNFPEDFDEFWLLVVKARLFNIFKYRGPEAYNRIVLKIRNIVRQFRLEVEERERQEAAAAAMNDIILGKTVVDESEENSEKTTAALLGNSKKTGYS